LPESGAAHVATFSVARCIGNWSLAGLIYLKENIVFTDHRP